MALGITRNRYSIYSTQSKKYDDELELEPGVNLSTSFFTLKRMLASNKKPLSSINKIYSFRILIGTFKWSSGELEKQITTGEWTVLEINQEILFNTYYKSLWSRCKEILRSKKKISKNFIPNNYNNIISMN